MVAFSSVLIADVMGATGPRQFETRPDASKYLRKGEELPQPIKDLYDALDDKRESRLLECYHDAMQARDAAMTLFNLGFLSLPLRALAERLFWATCARVEQAVSKLDPDEVSDELSALHTILSDVYFCNFSIFQSLPDSWAIDQLFPIMPIHRLDEEPTRRAILADVTCDSDGAVDHFINQRQGPTTLDVHPLHKGDDYFLGFFLVGAYQETLGDLHNLFGDTHVVHIELDEDGDWTIAEYVEGDTSAEVLSYMQYSPQNLQTRLSRDCEQAVKTGRMTVKETQTLRRFFEFGLASYTYLDTPGARTTAQAD
jgi:arginine decarboxylase